MILSVVHPIMGTNEDKENPAADFISQLDNFAFHLAKCGRFGPEIKAESNKIEQIPLPKCMLQKKHSRYL